MIPLTEQTIAPAADDGGTLRALLPGFGLCCAVTGAAYALQAIEVAWTGRAWLESLVLAILIGTAVRTLWSPEGSWEAGVAFSAKHLLEVAVVLLGASVSAATILAAGLPLLAGIAGVVVAAILLSFGVGRALGLPVRTALLVACGNSICGNSAIAAVAPVIGADSEDVAASIAFTAVLGVVVVLGLPVLGTALRMSDIAYGAFAGLTVYAVPQVIAAASPLGVGAVQIGALVKLVRVLMLGPVCLALSFLTPKLTPEIAPVGELVAGHSVPSRASHDQFVPWFIIGFVALMACRSLDLLPSCVLRPTSQLATSLTVVSMAALGLGVDVRTVAKAGARVIAAAVLSLLGLGVVSLALLDLLHIA